VEIGAGEFVDLPIEALVDLLKLLLGVDEAAEHAIEGDAEVLELVRGVDLGPGLDIATADLVADITEMLQRLVHGIVKLRVNRAVRRYGCCTDRIFDEDTTDSGFDD
jgi:hypothetical protein